MLTNVKNILMNIKMLTMAKKFIYNLLGNNYLHQSHIHEKLKVISLMVHTANPCEHDAAIYCSEH